jgi:hypothetical protein
MFTSTARERAFRCVASVGGGDGGGGGVVGASESEVDFWERDWHIDAVLLAPGGPGPQPPASGHYRRSEHSQCSLDLSPRHVRQLPHGRLQLSAAFRCSLHSAMEHPEGLSGARSEERALHPVLPCRYPAIRVESLARPRS